MSNPDLCGGLMAAFVFVLINALQERSGPSVLLCSSRVSRLCGAAICSVVTVSDGGICSFLSRNAITNESALDLAFTIEGDSFHTGHLLTSSRDIKARPVTQNFRFDKYQTKASQSS